LITPLFFVDENNTPEVRIKENQDFVIYDPDMGYLYQSGNYIKSKNSWSTASYWRYKKIDGYYQIYKKGYDISTGWGENTDSYPIGSNPLLFTIKY
jgi:hypothetical protein